MSGLNKNIFKFILIYVVLSAGIYFIFFTPKNKYKSKNKAVGILKSVPLNFGGWEGKAVKIAKNELKDDFYNFISGIFVIEYKNSKKEENLRLIIVDAGNFHYPKVCFKGAGYKVKNFNMENLKIKGKRIKVFSQLNIKEKEEILTVYWIVMDGAVVKSWGEQKFKQFFYSLFNKKHIGFMVRIDIPYKGKKTVSCINNFLNSLYDAFPDENRKYVFGIQ